MVFYDQLVSTKKYRLIYLPFFRIPMKMHKLGLALKVIASKTHFFSNPTINPISFLSCYP